MVHKKTQQAGFRQNHKELPEADRRADEPVGVRLHGGRIVPATPYACGLCEDWENKGDINIVQTWVSGRKRGCIQED